MVLLSRQDALPSSPPNKLIRRVFVFRGDTVIEGFGCSVREPVDLTPKTAANRKDRDVVDVALSDRQRSNRRRLQRKRRLWASRIANAPRCRLMAACLRVKQRSFLSVDLGYFEAFSTRARSVCLKTPSRQPNYPIWSVGPSG